MSTEAFLVALGVSAANFSLVWASHAVLQQRRRSAAGQPGPDTSQMSVRLRGLVPVITKSAITTALMVVTLAFWSPNIASALVVALDGVNHLTR